MIQSTSIRSSRCTLISRAVALQVLLVLTALPVIAQSLSSATPESVGMASERLKRLDAVMSEYVDQKRIAGTIGIIIRNGKVVYFKPFGVMDVEKNSPMRQDTIFRIASMSKAVTSIAAVILMEEGRLRLNDPVSKFLPAYRNTTVVVPPPPGAKAGTYSVVPAKRQITVRDLLTHTAGISYGWGSPAESDYKASGILGWYLSDQKDSIVNVAERLAKLPFDAHPGEKYVYGYNTDILGAVIEKASGMPLDQFFKTRIFEPLKMVDTAFFLPQEKRGRLATVYSAGEKGVITRSPDGGMGQGNFIDGPRTCFSGGAGLMSTATDYARMLLMMLNGGELDGVRILSPKSVELMTSSHTGSLYSEGNLGFGLGFEIVEHLGRSGKYGSVGTYGWGSAYYSTYWVDPQEKLVAIFLSQLVPSGELDLGDKFRALTYQAIVGKP